MHQCCWNSELSWMRIEGKMVGINVGWNEKNEKGYTWMKLKKMG